MFLRVQTSDYLCVCLLLQENILRVVGRIDFSGTSGVQLRQVCGVFLSIVRK